MNIVIFEKCGSPRSMTNKKTNKKKNNNIYSTMSTQSRTQITAKRKQTLYSFGTELHSRCQL